MVPEFKPCSRKTLGVEIEFQLLDGESLDLADMILPLLEAASGNPRIKAEVVQNTVEVTSGVCGDVAELESRIYATVRELHELCIDLGLRICGGGAHPFCKRLATITPLPRYQKIEEQAGYLSHNQITYATHVHVGMASGDEAIRVMRRLTPCLPLLLALSAASPFWRGYSTGHACYRHRLLAPSADYGLPPYFDGWPAFADFFAAAWRAGKVRSVKDVHWDVRPHADFGTLEIRVMDAQPTLHRSVALAALVHALVTYFADTPSGEVDQTLPRRLPDWMEKHNHYEAARLALGADLIVDESGDTRPIIEILSDLMEIIPGSSQGPGSETHGRIRRLTEDVSYLRQREVLRHAGSMRAVVADLVRQLEDDLQPVVA